MPARYYKQFFNFSEFSVEVFVIDTNQADANKICRGHGCDCPEADKCRKFFRKLWHEQFQWFKKALAESTAHWKIVVGHHPPDFHPVIEIIPEMVKHGAPIYLTG